MSDLPQSFQPSHLQPPILDPHHHPGLAPLLQGPHLWVPTMTPFGPILVLQPILPAPPQVCAVPAPPQATPSFCPWRPWEEKTASFFHQVPLSNRRTEVQTELNTSLSKEAEALQQRVRFSSSTSSGAGEQVDLIGSEIHCSSQAGHGDSGVEVDLSFLNLDHERDNQLHHPQELGEGTTVCQKSVDFAASKGRGTQDSGNAGQRDFGESLIQTCQKRKGKGMKKEVMMSFGMVKCDRGVRQKNVVKEGVQMEADGRGPGH